MPFGFNFRNTLAYVTDPASTVGVHKDSFAAWKYPRTETIGGDSVTFGVLDQTGFAFGLGRDRSTTVDARLAGLFQETNGGDPLRFIVDLPATGTYNLRAAFGDVSFGKNIYARVYDNEVLVRTIAAGTATAAGQFVDAIGVVRTSAADWVTNNAAESITFGSTKVWIEIAGVAATTGDSAVAHLNFEATGGAPAPTITASDATAFPGQSRTVTGTNFTGATALDINGTAQTDLVVVSDTSATYTAVLGDNSYGTGKTLTLTTPGGTATATIELVAAATGGYVDVTSPAINDTSSFAYNAEDALGNPVATGDQFEWRYTGTITAMIVGADTLATSVDQAGTVEGRFWDATDSTWGAWYMFTLDVVGAVIGGTMPRRIGVRSAVRSAVTRPAHSPVYRRS